METKSLKISKRTMSVVFETHEKEVCNLDRYKVVSIALLNGFYNPLRPYSETNPIDLNKLKELRNEYDQLINKTIGLINIDVELINKINPC